MKSYRLSELSKTEVDSLKARPRIVFSSIFSTVSLIQLLKRHLMLRMIIYMHFILLKSLPRLYRLQDAKLLFWLPTPTPPPHPHPTPGKDGSICKKAGVTHILKAGGAQAISAMAWGTSSCPKNSEAMVSIDMPAGPSEVLVIADKYASPVHTAADLLSR
ncbi:hypothetical protein MKW92_020122, partial [Papaver armeniacum]